MENMSKKLTELQTEKEAFKKEATNAIQANNLANKNEVKEYVNLLDACKKTLYKQMEVNAIMEKEVTKQLKTIIDSIETKMDICEHTINKFRNTVTKFKKHLKK